MLEHHAYLYRAEVVSPLAVKDIVFKLNISEVNYIELEAFGIDDVRTLTEKAFVRPLVGDKQLIVVCIKTITVEAQQALLKILEEPPISTVFLFCIPTTLYLLPTLLSRFQIENNYTSNEVSLVEFSDFVSLKVADRITEITNRLAKKDNLWVDKMKAGLLNYIQAESRQLPIQTLSALYFVSEHLQTRGASNKLLLEEMALTLK
jgi:DNA polymerase III delta prime subunit